MTFFNAVPQIAFIVLVITISGRIIWLKKSGIKVASKTEKNNHFKWIILLVFGILFILWLFEIIQPIFFKTVSILPEFATKMWFDFIELKIIGTLIVLFSLILWIITLLHFKTSLRFGLDQNNKGKLITTGVFAITRNPFFISTDIYFLGNALILPNLFFIGFAFLAIVDIHFFILKEEKFLLKNYGEEYKKYAKKVRRYF